MVDLRLDYQLLDEVRTSLGSLAGEFENIQATQNGYNTAMGSADITAAMNGFAGNWDTSRKKLLGQMQALQQMVHGTRQGFGKTDEGLRQQLAGKTR